MEAAAPQQVVVVQAAGKSALPKVIGIIAMVLGIIGVVLQVLIGGLLGILGAAAADAGACLLYTSPSPRDQRGSRMPSSA